MDVGALDPQPQLGAYVLTRRLAVDRVAAYFHATDGSQQDVLVRVLHDHLADDPRHVAAFRAEGVEGMQPGAPLPVLAVAQSGDTHYWVVAFEPGVANIRPPERPGFRPLERWLPVHSVG